MEQRTIRPRIADVAREAGVSKTALSFAFNCPDRLSTETASRIRIVAERLGYRGEEAVRLLLAVVGKTGVAVADHRRLETRLIVRGSSGQVRPSR